MQVQCSAARKLLVHACAWPASDVCGVLLGTKEGDEVRVADAVPLFHQGPVLPPMLQAALMSVDTFARSTTSPKLQLVAFYFADGTGGKAKDKLAPATAAVAARLQAQFEATSVLQLDRAQMMKDKLSAGKLPVTVYRGSEHNWQRRGDESVQIIGEVDLAADLAKGAVSVPDFEQHLEDPSIDYLNTKL